MKILDLGQPLFGLGFEFGIQILRILSYDEPMSILISLLIFSANAFSASGTGRAAAAKYFTKDITPIEIEDTTRSVASTPQRAASDGGSRLGFFAGTFLQKRAEEATSRESGGWSIRLDYQKEPQVGDFLTSGYQLVLQRFQAAGTELSNLTFFWSFRFPKEVVFPVYMGLAFGPGVFLKQLQDESWLSADMKGFLGLRLDGKQTRFYIEGGVQNQFLVLSSGQYQGWFMTSGVAYAF